MTPHRALRCSLPLKLVRFLFLATVFAVAGLPALWPAPVATALKAFDLPADTGDKSLSRFAVQAGVEVVFGSATAAQVRTNAVKGTYDARQALDLLLANTGLVVARDEKTGALTVSRDPNAVRAAPAVAGDRPGRMAKRATEKGDDEPKVVMSPFEVVADNHGYYAANTMSGTRLNSRIEDLGTSITVVTKEQMADFAMLDINDIFNYEASTEGTGNYTDLAFDQNGREIDNVQLNPTQANRIRGLNPANITLGNFETSGRVPLDPLAIDSIEISRGPNSSLFGIGAGGGTVNSVPSSANLTKNKSQVSFRGDSSGGYRTTVDLSRVIMPEKLAIRASTAYQHDGFDLKPSGINSIRLNGMVKARPFKLTTLTVSQSNYKMHGTRPNSGTPREAISGWIASGAPTWDPVARTVKVNGAIVGTFSGIPTQYFSQTLATQYSQIYVDRGGISHWGMGRTTSSTNPSVATGTGALMAALADPTGFLASQPLFNPKPPINSKAYYDWSSINLAAANRTEESNGMSSVLLEQSILQTNRHTLGLQLGWFHEKDHTAARSPLSTSGLAGIVNGLTPPLQIDVNERMLDGSPNPYFLRPFISSASPGATATSVNRESYRAQLAYRLDLREERNWFHWLGLHQLSGYAEYKRYDDRNKNWRDAIIDNHSWLGQGVARGAAGSAAGGLPGAPVMGVGFYNYYLGDSRGYNVDHGSDPYRLGSYDMIYGNPSSGFVHETVQLGSAILNNGGSLSIFKNRGAILQSHWLNDHLVTTLGWRYDERYRRIMTPIRLLSDGVNLDPASDQWATGDWGFGRGHTTTAGAVFRPVHWLGIYANKSYSFTPSAVVQNINLEIMADPRGRGEDYGLFLNFFHDKLSVRLNQYTTTQENRGGTSATLLNRLLGIDLSAGTSRLRDTATGWILTQAAAKGQTLTQSQIDAQLSTIMQLPLKYVQLPFPVSPGLGALDQLLARGKELEVQYNPTSYWTSKLNLTEQESINAHLSSEAWKWYDDRLTVWKSIIDPLTGRPWFTEKYLNSASAADILANSTTSIAVERSREGKSRPQIRKYRVNLSTSFGLRGISDNRFLKGINVGGALRWEDKGAIGYYGLQKPPAIVLALDPDRPIYDQGHIYVDGLIGYRTRLFSNKVGTTFQLNVRNLNEQGRLQPIAANPDGTPSAFRIIDPRKFILSATFDL
jgi:outer membrane receptor protein involved in Fe transport